MLARPPPDERSMSAYDPIIARLLALHPKRIDLSLDASGAFSTRLGHPERKIPPSFMSPAPTARVRPWPSCARCWRRPARSVHVYTSPHLVSFNERFRLGAAGGRAMVTEGALGRRAGGMRARQRRGADHGVRDRDRRGVPVVLTPARRRDPAGSRTRRPARRHQRDRDAARLRDHAHFEDHLEFLGDTIEKIAAEKAAILKRNVPAAIAPQTDAVLAVIEDEARRVRAPLQVSANTGACMASMDVWSIRTTTACSICRCQARRPPSDRETPAPPSPRCAPPGLALPMAAFEAGIAKAEWPARNAAPHAGPPQGAHAAGERALARWRPQRRWRPRGRGGDRRSRRARAAPAGIDRRHALDQG